MSTTRVKVARCRCKRLFPENILKFFVCFHCSSKQMPYLCPTFQLPLGMVSNHGCISIIRRGLSWWQSSLFSRKPPVYFLIYPFIFAPCLQGTVEAIFIADHAIYALLTIKICAVFSLLCTFAPRMTAQHESEWWQTTKISLTEHSVANIYVV